MDPDATLVALMDALIEGNSTSADYPREEAIEALDNLRHWLKTGGAFPRVRSVDSDSSTVSSGTFRIGQ